MGSTGLGVETVGRTTMKEGESEVATTVKQLEKRVDALEEATQESMDGLDARVAAMETVIENLTLALSGGKPKTRKTRKKRIYTDEERAAIRDRLVAGKEAAQARRDAEATEAEEDDGDFEDDEEEAEEAPAPRRRRRTKVAG